ncbi:MAG: glycosyltransferase [Isosphaeraceae bacterium]
MNTHNDPICPTASRERHEARPPGRGVLARGSGGEDEPDPDSSEGPPDEPRQGPEIGVVHVTFGLDVGGQERLLNEMARHAEVSQLSFTVVSLGHRGALAGEVEACGARVVALGVPVGLRPRLVWDLVRLFRRIRPDVVHTHDQRSLIYAAPAARLAAVKLIVHTRHGRDVRSTGRQRAVVRHLSRLVDRFVCVSADVAALSMADGIAPRRIETILNGIDTQRFSYSGPNPGGPVVAVARLSPEKDIANLVRAAAIARRSDPGLRIQVAGGGPRRGELDLLVRELGVDEIVTLLGETRDVRSVMMRGSIFVLPSRSEGISLTLLEAMASGLPTVATRVGGSPEIVVEGETGLLVPPADPEALAGALLRLRRDPEAACRMGQAGRSRVERDFSVQRMMDDYRTIYTRGRDARS